MAFCTYHNCGDKNDGGEQEQHFGKRKGEPARDPRKNAPANGADGLVKPIRKRRAFCKGFRYGARLLLDVVLFEE